MTQNRSTRDLRIGRMANLSERFVPKSGGVMLDKHATQRVNDGLAKIFVCFDEKNSEGPFAVFCKTVDGEIYDVMSQINPSTPLNVGTPLTFKTLSSMFHWFRKHASGENFFEVHLQDLDEFNALTLTVSPADDHVTDAENDELRLEAIKTALKKKGLTVSDIARSLGVTFTAVHRVIKGQTRSSRIEAAVATALEIDKDTLFATYHGYRELVE